jgi:hypothetical protein
VGRPRGLVTPPHAHHSRMWFTSGGHDPRFGTGLRPANAPASSRRGGIGQTPSL